MDFDGSDSGSEGGVGARKGWNMAGDSSRDSSIGFGSIILRSNGSFFILKLRWIKVMFKVSAFKTK